MEKGAKTGAAGERGGYLRQQNPYFVYHVEIYYQSELRHVNILDLSMSVLVAGGISGSKYEL